MYDNIRPHTTRIETNWLVWDVLKPELLPIWTRFKISGASDSRVGAFTSKGHWQFKVQPCIKRLFQKLYTFESSQEKRRLYEKTFLIFWKMFKPKIKEGFNYLMDNQNNSSFLFSTVPYFTKLYNGVGNQDFTDYFASRFLERKDVCHLSPECGLIQA